ncbi:hypothetical protein LCA32G_0768 [Lacticaseibacillus paracasei]|nr:hypothetical protein LCA32G_0768 [Lacticaseibacillus paracasei]
MSHISKPFWTVYTENQLSVIQTVMLLASTILEINLTVMGAAILSG